MEERIWNIVLWLLGTVLHAVGCVGIAACVMMPIPDNEKASICSMCVPYVIASFVLWRESRKQED